MREGEGERREKLAKSKNKQKTDRWEGKVKEECKTLDSEHMWNFNVTLSMRRQVNQ